MSSFKDFFRWYINKDVVPTLEAVKKIIVFYHDKAIDIVNLCCILPNLAKIAYTNLLMQESIHSRK